MPNEVLEKVRPLLAKIAERATATDTDGAVPPETIAELKAAGVFRMLQPEKFGGMEGNPVDFYEVVRAVSGACGSTGWVTSVLGVHPWQLALFDARAQEEVWGEDPDTLVSSAYAPVGRLRQVDGGYELSGRWSFSSGCGHASWVLVGALLTGSAGKPVDVITLLLPRPDYRIEEVWDVIGLRGTASNDILVDKVFVPAHRTIRNFDQARLRGPGQAVNTGPLYRMPFASIFTSTITAPIIGAVGGCYSAYISAMRNRTRLSLGGGRYAEDEFAHVAVARAASEIDAATLQMDRNIAELYDHVVQGEELPDELRLRTRRDQVRGTERVLEAIDILFKTAGGNSLKRGNPIERSWRDAHAGSVHVANDVERALAMYGRNEFGFVVEDSLM
ncbi:MULTISPECIES: 3-hydroxy-9,10-secoandrosta-1,3,5(10)-triene-9,17-dione monooxygenase oxygenase subunit [unclassified Nocardioides]|uniref:3-hydroxy-9,10-secoandrosta-1,3,5(10)-triene-9, 17-dione monooxygenase oxygenase subunit n=1 Tax=unclassified Nocardioides TaxID=2615069 RepID=UPI0006FF0A93|nr:MULTISPECIES: 3-hydroxy-9,10-secoandrosta-1,3,5(10)-triene-9,17-dione monooxygenase oxygenase subunit [unclassified Nocardioides]KQY54286.1 monooxygenase [Nocardioides sp. Root140]KQZ74908.1 monooxygenase [Nocardioides sp. Root151]KRF10442.1 monooxygenase [Nocardioides sp. Soil796]